MATTERKQYSFLNMKHCRGKENKEYVGVTVKGPVSKYSGLRTLENGKTYSSFNTPISNKAKYIGYMCGLAPTEDSNGTCWARVTLWDELAQRFDKLIQKHPSCIVYVTGSIRVEDRNVDGTVYRNVLISADDFDFYRDTKAGNGSANGNGPAYAGNADSDIPDGYSEFTDIDDDCDLPY